jgi:hypothetical protein
LRTKATEFVIKRDETQESEENYIQPSRMKWAGHVARMGKIRSVYRILVWKPEGKVPLRRPRPRCEDNINMDLQEVGYGGMDWTELAQDRDRWWHL